MRSIRAGAAPIEVRQLGTVGYDEAWQLQRELVAARVAGGPDTLLLLQHPSVYTAGKRTQPHERPLDGTPVVDTDRGGKITWHGPGQLVGYPILDLGGHRQDLHWYLRTLEEALIGALATLGLPAGREAGRTGVWIRGRKIASIGVHVRRWVTFHGFALNVQPDLRDFDLIVPCGIEGVDMTSIARELGLADRASAMEPESAYLGQADLWAASRDAVISAFAQAFDRSPRAAPADLLEIVARMEPATG